MTDRLETAGRAAIAVAQHTWSLDIFDPSHHDASADARRCKAAIDGMIRVGLGWSWEPPYAGDGDFEWCGAFAATCWQTLKPELRRIYFASTYRLDRYASYRSQNGEKNTGSGRLYACLDEHSTSLPFEPRAGDILMIGPAGSGYGRHITLVESFNPATRVFSTLEGNGTGTGPHGEHQQGVVRGLRALGGPAWHARRLIRPSEEDLRADAVIANGPA
jgi:hypothetical protein